MNSPLPTPYIFLRGRGSHCGIWGGVGLTGSGPLGFPCVSKVKTLELPYDEEIRLAVTGWSGTRWELPSDP